MSVQGLTTLTIVPIFASNEEGRPAGLYACRYPHLQRKHDELSHLFELWNDPLHVRKFCGRHKHRIQNHPYFMDVNDVNDAAQQIEQEVKWFEQQLLLPESDSAYQPAYTRQLTRLFEPLANAPIDPADRRFKAKASISTRNKFLRLYALQIEDGLFLITGGGMKFTRTMQQDPLLQQELEKLSQVANLLESHQIGAQHFSGQAFSIPESS